MAIPSVTAGGHAVPPPLTTGRLLCGRLRSRGRIKSEQCTMVKSSSFRHGKGVGDEVDLSFCKTNLHFAVRRNIIARRAISFPKEISFAAGKHHCRQRRLGEGGPSKTGDEVDPYFCTNKSPFRQRRNIIARRAISFLKEKSFAAGKHHCRRRRLGG